MGRFLYGVVIRDDRRGEDGFWDEIKGRRRMENFYEE